MSGSKSVLHIPEQAATAAGPIDLLILAITVVSIVFTVIVVAALIFFVVKYRRGHEVDRSNPPLENLPIEIAWTGLPLVIGIGLFVWSTALFLEYRQVPAGALEVYVTGKQWMWKFQHPAGRWENNSLHLPTGRPILLKMTSEDVIHSFFVPAFRLHQDVVPGEYSQLWFKPTKRGVYHLFCAQFCGTLHSQMTGTVTVMDPAAYEDWLSTGKEQRTLAAAGQALFVNRGCAGCHSANTDLHAPTLEGIYGKPIPIQIPPPGTPTETPADIARLFNVMKSVPATTVIADDRYIHDSILLPAQEVAAGYLPVMPTFKNRITEEEIMQIVAYIKSLAGGGGTGTSMSRVRGGPARALSVDEYRARVGFTPTDIGGAKTGQRPTNDQGRTTTGR